MKENDEVEINEILDEIDRLFTEEDLEGEVTLNDLLLEAYHEEMEKSVLYGSDWTPTPNNNQMGDNDDIPGEYIMLSRGGGKQSRINEYNDEALAQFELSKRYVAEDVSSLASLMESFSKTAHSVAEWAEKTYGISPITGDSTTHLTLLFTDTTEEPVRPKKRGQRCSVCSNMTKKELKKHDSCPSCGRSLFALKSRGW